MGHSKVPFSSFLIIHGKTVIVPLQKTDLVLAFAQKYKHIPAHGVKVQFVPYQACQRVDAVTHIGRLAVKKITARIGKGQHRSVTKGFYKIHIRKIIEIQRCPAVKVHPHNGLSLKDLLFKNQWFKPLLFWFICKWSGLKLLYPIIKSSLDNIFFPAIGRFTKAGCLPFFIILAHLFAIVSFHSARFVTIFILWKMGLVGWIHFSPNG